MIILWLLLGIRRATVSDRQVGICNTHRGDPDTHRGEIPSPIGGGGTGMAPEPGILLCCCWARCGCLASSTTMNWEGESHIIPPSAMSSVASELVASSGAASPSAPPRLPLYQCRAQCGSQPAVPPGSVQPLLWCTTDDGPSMAHNLPCCWVEILERI